MLSDNKRAEIAAAARELVGVPWVHVGRSKSGVDCLGVLIWSGKKAGLIPESFDVIDYQVHMEYNRLVKGLPNYMEVIPTFSYQEGDAILFNVFGRIPIHLGLVVNGPANRMNIIQAKYARKVIETSLSGSMKESIFRALRYKEGAF